VGQFVRRHRRDRRVPAWLSALSDRPDGEQHDGACGPIRDARRTLHGRPGSGHDVANSGHVSRHLTCLHRPSRCDLQRIAADELQATAGRDDVIVRRHDAHRISITG
jgi:hypothetical protein